MMVHVYPLKNKYYSTWVDVVLDNGNVVHLEVTSHEDEPSERETFLLEHPEEICDGHYERQATWEFIQELERRFSDPDRPSRADSC